MFLANALFLPMASKLKQLSTIEVAHKLLIVEGIMAIQAGVSPRVVEELLKSHVPPSERDEVVRSPEASEAPAAKPKPRSRLMRTSCPVTVVGSPEEHEEHVNHEAWVIPYADLLTLLMAMFIALFAISTVDSSKFKALSVGFNEALGGGKLDSSVFAGSKPKDTSPIPGNGNGNGPGRAAASSRATTSSPRASSRSCSTRPSSSQNAKAQEAETLKKRAGEDRRRARAGGFASDIHTELQSRGLVVTVVTDKVLFDSGSAALRKAGDPLLHLVGGRCAGGSEPDAHRRLHRHRCRSRPRSTRRTSSCRARADRVAEYFMSIGLASRGCSPRVSDRAIRSRRTPRPPDGRATGGSRSSCSRRWSTQTLDNAGPRQDADHAAEPVRARRARRRQQEREADGADISPHLGAG